MSNDKEILALRTEVAELRAQMTALQANREQGLETSNETEEATSRRNMLKAGLIATGAIAGTVLTGTQEAVAADPNDIVKGQVTTVNGRTDLRHTGGLLTHNIFTVQDSSFGSSSRRAAIGGFADGTSVHSGVYGYTSARDNTDSQTGHALIANATSGGRSALYMIGGGGDPKFDTYSHARGEQRMQSGNLWLCTNSGTPGTWKKLSGPAAAGSFHLLSSPQRAYDSRVSEGGTGPLTPGAAETVDMTPSGVPSGISGVLVNLTMVAPPTGGFAVLWSNGASQPGASSINFAAGQVLGNNVTTRVDSNRIAQIFSFSATEYVVDVVGYYL